MAKAAIKSKDIPSRNTAQAQMKRIKKQTQLTSSYQDQTWEDLSGAEKAEVAKLVAIKLGFVAPSE